MTTFFLITGLIAIFYLGFLFYRAFKHMTLKQIWSNVIRAKAHREKMEQMKEEGFKEFNFKLGEKNIVILAKTQLSAIYQFKEMQKNHKKNGKSKLTK